MDRNAFLALAAATMLHGCALFERSTPEPAPVPDVVPEVVEQAAVPESFPNILFEPGRLALSLEQREQIRAIAEMLKIESIAHTPVLVTGHTDAQGTARSNRKAGLKRAAGVAEELVFNGISSERLTVESRGESEPIAANKLDNGKDNPDGRALNRRVEIILQN